MQKQNLDSASKAESNNNLFSILFKRWNFPGKTMSDDIHHNLSLTERVVFYGFVTFFAFSSFFLFFEVNSALMVEVPAQRGSFSEGLIGFPRTINPLLASDSSDTDKDLTFLIYSGLLRATPDGNLVNDLSESYSISEDRLTYHFVLKDKIFFHDGSPITSDDIKFTVEKTQDILIKSPKRINWEGVKIEIINEKEFNFILPQPYAPFLENTTIGILPKHLWKNLAPDQFASSLLNLEPIGSGPYMIDEIKRDSSGLPIFYKLKSFNEYKLGKPNIKNIFIRFYSNEEELISSFQKNQIDNLSGLSPQTAVTLQNESSHIEHAALSRIFGVFFNQNQASVFTNIEVRKALDVALDKDKIVETILSGFGKAISSPLPYKYQNPSEVDENQNDVERINKAKTILIEGGWKFNEEEKVWVKKFKSEEIILSFSISTADTPDLKFVAELVKSDWEKLGAKVDLKIFDLSDLKQNVIRPRKYDALLFGTILGRDLDFFPFWHSSQRNDPGLNVALYANIKADKILQDARLEIERDERIEKYQEFETIIKQDIPAIFIYSPELIYIVPNKIQNLKLDFLTMPSDRFLNVHEWFIETDSVWKVFAN